MTPAEERREMYPEFGEWFHMLNDLVMWWKGDLDDHPRVTCGWFRCLWLRFGGW